jgi:8-amino-7-oxononanoate synthase
LAAGEGLNYIIEKRKGARGVVDGREVVIFSTNDYLALSCHPEVLKATSKAADEFGTGTGGAPGTSGTNIIHRQLCETVASFKSRDKAVLFPSGYQANIAVHQALGGDDTVFHVDSRHHPSAVDGARLGKGSPVMRFSHRRLTELESAVKSNENKTNIVSLPSVFTVDGDIAPLNEIIDLKKKLGFALVLDEAHATGCVGRTGRGLEEHFGLKGAADFIMGTFSKALGSQGGFLAYNGSSEKYLKSKFRPFEYSTSLSTVSAAAALKALELLEKDPAIYNSLKDSKERISTEMERRDIEFVKSESMIMLVPCDDCEQVQEKLLSRGYLCIITDAEVSGKHRECLRVTPNASHTEKDIEGFAEALAAALT